MEHRLYRALTLKRLRGRRVRLNRPIETNSGILYPEGTVLVVIGKRGGLDLRGTRCGHCGVSPAIHQVSPAYVDLVDTDEGATAG